MIRCCRRPEHACARVQPRISGRGRPGPACPGFEPQEIPSVEQEGAPVNAGFEVIERRQAEPSCLDGSVVWGPGEVALDDKVRPGVFSGRRRLARTGGPPGRPIPPWCLDYLCAEGSTVSRGKVRSC